MALEIKVEDNLDGLTDYLDDLKTKAAIDALRFSMNRTLLSLRDTSTKRIRDRLNIKAGVLKKKHLKMIKARGGNLHSMEALLKYNSKPVPLLEFVQGKKDPAKQKGIPIAKRRTLKARIRPGKTVRLKSAFIADVNSKQVFKRRGPGTRRVKKQGVTSVGFIFNKPLIRNELTTLAGKRMAANFTREYKRRVEQLGRRRNRKFRTRR